jgi:hypothetical protein
MDILVQPNNNRLTLVEIFCEGVHIQSARTITPRVRFAGIAGFARYVGSVW